MMTLYNIKQDEINIPSELRGWDQWVCWRYNNAGQKPPVDPRTDMNFDLTDPTRWLSCENAIAAAQEHSYEGVGVVVTEDDPLCGLDFDHCGDRETGYVHPAVVECLEQLGNPYAEWSPSGEGIRAFVKGAKPGSRCKTSDTPWGGDFEIYDSKRFLTVTGDVYQHGPIVDAQEVIEDIYHEFFPEPETAVSEPPKPLPDRIGLTDDEVLERCRQDANGRAFIAMYDYGDTSSFGGDESRADYAVMRKLRYYTRADTVQMERLFKDSALVRREKMDGRVDDLTRRVMRAAMDSGGDVYDPDFKPMPVRDEIRRCLNHALFVHPWREHAGRADAAATDYYGYRGILRIAHQANTLEVDMSERRYMEECGMDNYESALRSLAQLQESGLVEKISDGGYAGAARYRIKSVSKGNHILIGDIDTPPVITTCDYELTPLKGTHLFRKPSRRSNYLINPPSKSAAMALDIIHATYTLTGKPVSLESIAKRLGTTTKYLKRHQLRRLINAELIEPTEPGYITPENVQEIVERELHNSGSLAAAKRRRARHERDHRRREIERLKWTGKNRYEILHETGYDWEEIAALVSEVVDSHPEPGDGEIEPVEQENNVVEMPLVKKKVLPEALVYTDEYRVYDSLNRDGYRHDRVHHAEEIYVAGDVHTNTIEGFWSLLKRGIGGVYHSVSAKHLQGYLDEYAFRYNHRKDPGGMFNAFIGRIEKADPAS